MLSGRAKSANVSALTTWSIGHCGVGIGIITITTIQTNHFGRCFTSHFNFKCQQWPSQIAQDGTK